MQCTVRDCKVHYKTCGEGTPILMIHGGGPDHRMMEGCMEPVFHQIDTPWMRIYFDLPGMGKTRREPWIDGSDQMLELILGFIDAVIPNRRFVVAGDSYGGYLARGLVYKRPSMIDGLLLICPQVGGAGGQYHVFEKDDALLDSLAEEERSFFTREGICVLHNKRVWERFREEVLPGLKIADRKNGNGGFSFNADELAKPYLKPTLMLAGRQDSLVGYRGLWEIVESYPRASFVLLDKAGHALQIEQEVLFTETVKEWLGRVAAELG